MLKKFSIAIGSLFAVLVVACSSNEASDIAGGTIDPNTIAANSSSSIAVDESSSSLLENTNSITVSSSSVDIETNSPNKNPDEGNHSIKIESSSSGRTVIESSSSLEDSGSDVLPIDASSSSEKDRSNVIVRPRNFSLECSVDVVNVDPDEPAVSSDVLAPYASKSVAADSVNILISDYFNIPCGESEAEAFMERANTPEYTSLGLNYDTLYVKVIRSKGMSYDCSCVARVQFTLDADYSGLKYTVLEQRDAIPLEELE
ncbi:MAG: hypothetical protein IKN70_10445 [Fibrobacter sp.]|nr:hypothetical protein [Fibrobacter sp.]